MNTATINGVTYEVLQERKIVGASNDRHDAISIAIKRPNGKRLYTATRFDWKTGPAAGMSSFSKVISLHTNI